MLLSYPVRLDTRFTEVYKAYHWHIYAYCLRRTRRELVDDAVAETFLTAWRKVDDLPVGSGVLPWLYSVAYRVLGRQWRAASRHKRLVEKLAGAGLEYVAPPEMFVVANHESDQIVKAVSKLKPSDREIIRLAVWEDLDRPQIALVLGISTGAVNQEDKVPVASQPGPPTATWNGDDCDYSGPSEFDLNSTITFTVINDSDTTDIGFAIWKFPSGVTAEELETGGVIETAGPDDEFTNAAFPPTPIREPQRLTAVFNTPGQWGINCFESPAHLATMSWATTT